MAKTLKHIHILGIAGVMTAPLAMALKNQGCFVTGSDQENIYSPTSEVIAGIPVNTTPIDKSIDLAIIGSSYLSFSKCIEEFNRLQQLNIPYISATEFLAQNIIKSNSILVAGSYAKTTITALISWILDKTSYHPNYFFGGQLKDGGPSLKLTTSPWSVVEADESINGLDTQAKFLSYPVKYLILTSARWEHKDSYPTAAKNLAAYRQLIKRVPKNGFIIYNGHDREINKIISHSLAPTFDYQSGQIFSTKLVGQYNQENIAAAYTLCLHLNVQESHLKKAIASFPGIKKRLEKIYSKNNIYIYDDFAQSAPRIKAALEALKYSYPHHHLKVYLEPHATFLQNPSSLREFSKIFPLVEDFVLGPISFSARHQSPQRVSAKSWQKIFSHKFHYFPLNEALIDYLSTSLQPGDLLIHFSSGGLEGQNNLKKVYNNLNP